MITFFISLFLLIIGFIFFSRFTEKIFKIDDRKTPAIDHPDGVDITPLPKWKAFLIELLNIAGTGPIFGAISGALFGPIAFLWIVIGCIVGGAVHDYYSGMISSRNNGDSIVKLSGKYLGKTIEIIMRIFSIILLILVTAVFVVSPSTLLESLTSGNVSAWIWMIIILVYYFLSTILPIDKIIGKAYPVFGVLLITMAVSVIIGILCNQNSYPMLELIGNFKDYSLENSDKERVFLTMLEAWGFNPAFGMRYCMNDIGFYAEMLEKFVSDADERIEKMNRSLADEDINNYRIVVNSLKSSSRSIGCEDLSVNAKESEEAAKRDDGEYIKENHEKLVDMLRNTVRGINTTLGFFRS